MTCCPHLCCSGPSPHGEAGEKSLVQEGSVLRASAQLAGTQMRLGQKNRVRDHASSVAGIAEG